MTNESLSSPAKHPLDNKIPPPFVAVLIAALMWTSRFAEGAIPIAGFTRVLASCIAVALGATSLALGFLAFRRARTTIDPVLIHRASNLVTYGIYRLTRNPMYVGFTLLLLGWAVFLAVPLAVLGPAIFVLFTNRFQIIPEERVMKSKFGEAYEEYRQKVRRWI